MRITIPQYRRFAEERDVPDGRGGTMRIGTTRSIPDGHLSAEIVLEIDTDALTTMLGYRALRNRSRKSTLADGLIRVTAINLIRHKKES